ncbi:MAG: hypothetical protein J3R72DRAFT_186407 [Linnemannia gamsii]|nr:MAG: hypothetical protein J3R72DRAFT_186407 [Linnemannia gamsii]
MVRAILIFCMHFIFAGLALSPSKRILYFHPLVKTSSFVSTFSFLTILLYKTIYTSFSLPTISSFSHAKRYPSASTAFHSFLFPFFSPAFLFPTPFLSVEGADYLSLLLVN